MPKLDELAQEATAAPQEGTIPVPLGDAVLEVKPTLEWRSSGIAALNVGNFEVWAATCLTPESYEQWVEIDPTVAEIKVFMQDFRSVSRDDLGKSKASPR